MRYYELLRLRVVTDPVTHLLDQLPHGLYRRFETPSRRAEYLDRKIKRTHNQLTRLLDKPGRKLLLRIADMEDELRDEACLNSFISGYRLAQGIQQELLADQPPYSFEAEDERQACEKFSQEESN